MVRQFRLLLLLLMPLVFAASPAQASDGDPWLEQWKAMETVVGVGDPRLEFLLALSNREYYVVVQGVDKIDINFRTGHVLLKNLRGYPVSGSPLSVASGLGEIQIIELLGRHGAHMDNPWETIYPAAGKGQLECFRYFYDKGIAANANDDELLLRAVQGGNLEILQFLIEKGHKADFKKGHLLCAAVQQPNTKVVEYLLELGVDPTRTSNGRDVLACCLEMCTSDDLGVARQTNWEAIRLLIQHGANPFSPAKNFDKSLFFEATATSRPLQRFSYDELYSLIQANHVRLFPNERDVVIAKVLTKRLLSLYDYTEFSQYMNRKRELDRSCARLVRRLLDLGAIATDEALRIARDECGYLEVTKLLMEHRGEVVNYLAQQQEEGRIKVRVVKDPSEILQEDPTIHILDLPIGDVEIGTAPAMNRLRAERPDINRDYTKNGPDVVPMYVAGFTPHPSPVRFTEAEDREAARDFVRRLQELLNLSKWDYLARMVNYPMRLGKDPLAIMSREEFMNNAMLIFTDAVRRVILSQDPDAYPAGSNSFRTIGSSPSIGIVGIYPHYYLDYIDDISPNAVYATKNDPNYAPDLDPSNGMGIPEEIKRKILQ